ncbi:AAA domain-containing protein [candidate division KSB1 bacterium]|nr:AAA domain-containing protein [candidate division KSB1 bacterium]
MKIKSSEQIFEKIMREQHIAFALFNQDLTLESCSSNFYKVLDVEESEDNVLWTFFPELIGNEECIDSLLGGNQRRLHLEQISRFKESGDLSYYNLTLSPLKNSGKNDYSLICIVSDVTSKTLLQQQLQQQRNDIELLRASLIHYHQHGTYKIIGKSRKIREIRNFIDKISNIRNTTILIQGESGTGKNLVARGLHYSSIFKDKPFIEVNCAAIPENLLEAELFGYEKGAFTNAVQSKRGLIEEADEGTIFLDEISEMPFSLQAKLLSVIETKSFRRLGSTQLHHVKLRIIAATNRDLKKAVENKEFRQDLYFRINVVMLELPPLRDLDDDILEIADLFLQSFVYDFGKKIKGFSKEAKEKLMAYNWPGNVRELRNVIERAVIFTENDFIQPENIILSEFQTPTSSQKEHDALDLPANGLSLYEMEKRMITQALERSNYNQTKAANLLGISLDTLRYRIKKYKLE